MNTENYLELPTNKGIVLVSKTSIDSIEENQNGIGVVITLKEKRPSGEQISFDVNLPFVHIVSEINKYEKITP